ncbi:MULTISPECIES: organic hydroperoxide resistance protein [Caulobacter]|jgi:osmotically inducible protein OsmC|uniref:Peroxiredoxin, Ohr subfamily n=1 Tax=Caulobacter vibrioides OR37 TaxID=1292034 RepID=R0CZ26_CAUVI|nr:MULTISPECIES: organic hydroperoxide resistance protein [Caulobacter]ENZ81525.1 peroxiredoxin, Ohr subfamily [Caulobacter vibrioides OR37]MBQ1562198.1 organic hydroperoxide resistance protein [Caulobacter sp.]
MTTLYSTRATVVGGREGHVRSEDGLLDVQLSMPKALGGKETGTNPEQLFAAGYAACFQSAMAHVARTQKIALTGSTVTGQVGLATQEVGFKLEVALEVETQGLSQADAEALVATAHQVCPYSNATRGNVDVAITVKAS